jgi:hypothetical protein
VQDAVFYLIGITVRRLFYHRFCQIRNRLLADSVRRHGGVNDIKENGRALSAIRQGVSCEQEDGLSGPAASASLLADACPEDGD